MKLILNGGGIGEKAKEARKILNQNIDHSKKILYIPFAWPDSTYNGCLEFMEKELEDVEKTGIDMVKNVSELNLKRLSDYSCIYIGGGNTFKLLKILKDSGNFDRIKEYIEKYDGIIYGGSAGAIIFGENLESCKTDDINEVNLKDLNGFNMINGYSLLCHYTNRDKERVNESTNYLQKLSNKYPTIAIPEEDTIYIENDKIQFYGNKPYYIFGKGIRKVFLPIQNGDFKIRDLKRDDWDRIKKKTVNICDYSNKYFNAKIALLKIEEVSEPLEVETQNGKIKIVDSGYKDLIIAPKNENWWLTVIFDEKNNLIESYFDITKINDFTYEENPFFIDMKLDICILNMGKPFLLDEEELDETLEKGYINQNEYDKAFEIANKIINEYNLNKDKYYEFIFELFNKLI